MVVVGDNVEMKLLVFARVTALAAKTFQGCHLWVIPVILT